MSKDTISDYDSDANENTEIGGIGIQGSDPVKNMDDALRQIMAHLADMNSGLAPLDDSFTIAHESDRSKQVTLDVSDVSENTKIALKVPDQPGTILLSEHVGELSLNAENLVGQIENANLPDTLDAGRMPTEIASDITGNAATADDAALLDGQEASYYLDATNLTGTIENAQFPAIITSDISGNAATATDADTLDGQEGSFYQDASNLNTGTISSARLAGAYNIDISGQAASLENNYASTLLTPAGAVMYFAMESPPSGWLKADGAAVSRAEYANLFLAIGEVFGSGDGSTTFNLPDLRGEFLRGFDDGRGVDGSRTFASEQTDESKAHNHYLFSSVSTFFGSEAGGHQAISTGNQDYPIIIDGNTQSSINDYYFRQRSEDVEPHISKSETIGGDETRPRNIALLACIKA